MMAREVIGFFLVGLGLLFFSTTAVGMLRFPDTVSRLHALAKADNPGLGCIAFGLACLQPDLLQAGKIILVWGVTLFASATSAFSLARHVRHVHLPSDPDGSS